MRLAVFSTVPYEPFVDKKKRSGQFTVDRIKNSRAALLRWHKVHGRHELAWRRQHDPYAVLVSEFMLQQTTVATVEPRFTTWMRIFPSIADLAAASEQEVLAAWQGLGYYSRARRLHRAAQLIVERHEGSVPEKEEALLKLPGIGTYTAAAIMAFAHDKSAVVLDTNIIRVLSRWSNLTTPIDTASGKKALINTATSFFPATGCRSVASALMDLGASICTTGIPQCSACPLENNCLAGTPETLPIKSPRALVTKVTEFRAWHSEGESLFLQQSQGPRWRGLWILPELGDIKTTGRMLAQITYPITRYRVTMKIFRLRGTPPAGLRSFKAEELDSLPIPSPHRSAIMRTRRAIAAKRVPSHNCR